MIYTVTFSPALDYMVKVNHLELGAVNKMVSNYYLPGGKGINVSIVLNNLEVDSVALGYLGGFVGKEIERHLEKLNIKTDMIEVSGNSRINVKINSDKETEINAIGPDINDVDIRLLKDKIAMLNEDDFLVLSGSIPKQLETSIYFDFSSITQAKVVVDATGEVLMECLKSNPFLIKPNIHELEDIFGYSFSDMDEIYSALLSMQDKGARNIIVSMGKNGALYLNEGRELYYATSAKGELKNSVGAGDSMVAGFIGRYLSSQDMLEAFKYSCACGSAAAFSDIHASKEVVEMLYLTQQIRKVR